MNKKQLYLFRLRVDMDERKHHVDWEHFAIVSEDGPVLSLVNIETATSKEFLATNNLFEAGELGKISAYIKTATRRGFQVDGKLDITIAISALTRLNTFKYKDFILAICKTEIWLCRKD